MGNGFQSALFYLLTAWTAQIKSVNYNIELWVLPNLITLSYSCSCPKCTYLFRRYIVYRRIRHQATHCKVVFKWTELISLYSLLYHLFVELSVILCYLSLQFKLPIVLDIVELLFVCCLFVFSSYDTQKLREQNSQKSNKKSSGNGMIWLVST